MKIVFCGFGNPDSRGCEAIIRTASAMVRIAFSESEIIASSNDYGITHGQVCNCTREQNVVSYTLGG